MLALQIRWTGRIDHAVPYPVGHSFDCLCLDQALFQRSHEQRFLVFPSYRHAGVLHPNLNSSEKKIRLQTLNDFHTALTHRKCCLLRICSQGKALSFKIIRKKVFSTDLKCERSNFITKRSVSKNPGGVFIKKLFFF